MNPGTQPLLRSGNRGPAIPRWALMIPPGEHERGHWEPKSFGRGKTSTLLLTRIDQGPAATSEERHAPPGDPLPVFFDGGNRLSPPPEWTKVLGCFPPRSPVCSPDHTLPSAFPLGNPKPSPPHPVTEPPLHHDAPAGFESAKPIPRNGGKPNPGVPPVPHRVPRPKFGPYRETSPPPRAPRPGKSPEKKEHQLEAAKHPPEKQ